jgi:hypothetical protein
MYDVFLKKYAGEKKQECDQENKKDNFKKNDP